jgi:hypothetical protein
MSGPGYVFKDSGTTPPAMDETVANQYDPQHVKLESLTTAQAASHTSQEHLERDKDRGFVAETTKALQNHGGASSHELAQEVNLGTGAGAVQMHTTSESYRGTRDVGWHKPTADIPDPLVFDIPNGRLWSMIRRFNKVRLTFLTHLYC